MSYLMFTAKFSLLLLYQYPEAKVFQSRGMSSSLTKRREESTSNWKWSLSTLNGQRLSTSLTKISSSQTLFAMCLLVYPIYRSIIFRSKAIKVSRNRKIEFNSMNFIFPYCHDIKLSIQIVFSIELTLWCESIPDCWKIPVDGGDWFPCKR